MTKQEIKDLVAAKIAGQGTQVDLGGVLPTVLSEIIDMIPEGGGGDVQNAGVFLNLGDKLVAEASYTDAEFDARFGAGMAAALREGIANKNIVAIRSYDSRHHEGGVYFPADEDGLAFGNRIDEETGKIDMVYAFELDDETISVVAP